jgi:hypothetical protein
LALRIYPLPLKNGLANRTLIAGHILENRFRKSIPMKPRSILNMIAGGIEIIRPSTPFPYFYYLEGK